MMSLRGLLIQLTRRCPLECAHCYVSASPKEKATIANELVVKAIKEYAALQNAHKAVCLTGGDPFTVLPVLTEAVHCARSLDFFVHVNTSAFFAGSLAKSLKILQRFEGLSQLEVSVDQEHQRFVPLENVCNALMAARILHIRSQIAIQAEDRASRVITELLKQFPETTLYVQNFAPVGERNHRAGSHPDLMPQESHAGCAKVGSIFVDEMGYVFPCTSAVVSSRAREAQVRAKFALGQLTEHPLEVLLAKLNSPRLRAVKCIGPSAVRRFMEADSPPRTFRSYCDECVYLATSEVMDNEGADEKGELLEWAMRDSPSLV